jgi:hypothetical protein
MGHQIYALTSAGERIEGPYLGRTFGTNFYWFLDANSQNAGFSGDGNPMKVTPEQIRLAIGRVSKELTDAQRKCEHYEAVGSGLSWCGFACNQGGGVLDERAQNARNEAASALHRAVQDAGAAFTVAEHTKLLALASSLVSAGVEWDSTKLLAAQKRGAQSLHFHEIYQGLLEDMLDFLKHCFSSGEVEIVFC